MSTVSASSLALEQSLLLAALFGDADGPPLIHASLKPPPVNVQLPARGLQAYRANGEALAGRALAAAYPVIAELLGEESFMPLAACLWRLQPPQRGDMALWGTGLAEYLEAAPQLADEQFLGDVARVEWALHCAATAEDAVQDLQSLALLAGEDAGLAGLVLSGGVALFASNWPVAGIVQAHLLQEPEKAQALANLAGLLHAGHRTFVLVWRQGFKPRFRLIGAAEHALLAGLLAGLTLESALATASEAEDIETFDFSLWLGDAVQAGLVTGAKIIHHSGRKTS